MLSVLKSSLRGLLAVFGMSSHSISEIPPASKSDLPLDRTSVEQWCITCKERYTNRLEFRKYQVVEIARYKKKRGPQHEYVVATVEHPDYGTSYLKIERDRAHLDENGAPVLCPNQLDVPPLSPGEDISQGFWATWSQVVSKSDPRPPEPSSLSGAVAWSTAFSRDHPASDVVSPWTPPGPFDVFSDIELLNGDRFEFRDDPLPLVHLAILADAVHKKESLYNLFVTQCYWYSNMIARVLARDKKGTQTDGDSSREDTDDCYDPASGKWRSIRVHWVKPKVITAIQKEYHARRDKFDEEVRIVSSKVALI